MLPDQKSTRPLELALGIAAGINATLGAFFAYRGFTVDGVFFAVSAILFAGCGIILVTAASIRKKRTQKPVNREPQSPS